MDLREEDLMQVLGVEHKLHVRKILVSREKLKPLSQQEKEMITVVQREVRMQYYVTIIYNPSIKLIFHVIISKEF